MYLENLLLYISSVKWPTEERQKAILSIYLLSPYSDLRTEELVST